MEEENKKVISLKEAVNIFKRIWAFILVAFVLGWACSVLVGFFEKKGFYQAVHLLNIKVNPPAAGDASVSNQYINDNYNYVENCFNNPETRKMIVEWMNDDKFNEDSYNKIVRFNRSSNIFNIVCTNKSKQIASDIVTKIYELGNNKIQNNDISIETISVTVDMLKFELVALIFPSVIMGVIAGVIVYLIYFLYYVMFSLSTRRAFERALNIELVGVITKDENAEFICLNDLYVNVRDKENNKVIIYTDSDNISSVGITKVATAYKYNGKRAIIIDCTYDKENLSDVGQGIIDANSKNYKAIIRNVEGIDAISSNGLNKNTFSYLSSADFKELINTLKVDYDVVLLHAMPLSIYSDALIFLELDGSSLLVGADLKEAKKKALLHIGGLLKDKSVETLGSIAFNVKEYFYKTN